MINSNYIADTLESLRSQSPLVHNITNYVVMNSTANALLSIGASPVMAHAVDEVADMVNIASSLVINMCTLSEKWVESMIIAGLIASKNNTPIVFDPVGVGATKYRTQVAQQIISKCKPTVIRGNASEIMALCNANIKTKGVDSTASSDSAVDSAKLLAKQTKAIVVISGAIDYITDGDEVISINNGSPLMPKVTGMGCTCTAIIGAFVAVNNNTLENAAAAMAVMGIAGEMATEISKGPGSLQMNILDTLYNISSEDILKRFR